MHISARTFVNDHIIYIVVSSVDDAQNITDKYTVSFATEHVENSLQDIHLFLWEHTAEHNAPRAFTDHLRKHIAAIGYFSITEDGMQAPLNSEAKLDIYQNA